MNPLNEHRLEGIRVRPLSDGERARVWARLSSQLATTPARSPFVSLVAFRGLASVAIAAIIVVGTLGASNSARPGDLLFSVDLAAEHIEASLAPSSRARHATERLAEFEAVVSTLPPAPVAVAPMAKRAAPPPDDTLATFSMMAESAPTESAITLPPEAARALEAARVELTALLIAAIESGDDATAATIQSTLEQLEVRAASLGL